MLLMFPFIVLTLGLWIQSAKSCFQVSVLGHNLNLTFTQLPISLDGDIAKQTGRASYVSQVTLENGNVETMFLYHTIVGTTGVGRWVMNDRLGDDSNAMAYIDSWAVTPFLTSEIMDIDSPNKYWHHFYDQWNVDESLVVSCDEEDDSIYFESSPIVAPHLAGFYVPRIFNHSSPVYSKIKTSVDDPDRYLYALDNKWMIGDVIGLDGCEAHVENDAEFASGIYNSEWKFVNPEENADETWVYATAHVVSRVVDEETVLDNIYQSLRYQRSVKYIPKGQDYFTLRNKLPMPKMGLGTGGLYPGDETHDVIKEAMKLGYRSFDLAREYGNEHVIAQVLQETKDDPEMPKREDLFLETKVWPTELGFYPTSIAIEKSLEELQSNYVDLYMLHWPSCNHEIDWMHCETTVDPDGTWEGSWEALEKAYAEGRVMAIGASNFNINLLDSFDAFTVRPHVVQNWAEPGSMDLEVLYWTRNNAAVYQPYASLRNLHQLQADPKVAESLSRIAKEKNISEHKVALRFMLQAGMSPIPRSAKREHLLENLNAFKWELSKEEFDELWGDSNAEEL